MKYAILILSCLLLIRPAGAQTAIDTTTTITQNPKLFALLINKDGRTIYQHYFNGHHETDLMNDQSLTKSVVSLLLGIAIEKGFIKSIDEPVVDFFPELRSDPDPRKRQVTIREISNQASGLFHEDLTSASGIPDYLNAPSQKDVVLRAPMTANPGETWHYSNAATHLLSVILTKATRMDTYSFARKCLFGPLGITTMEWMKMKDGYYDGCGLLSIRMRPEDMLKIGLLILNRGRYNGRQVIPEKWIDLILNPDKFYSTYWGFDHSTYGLCYYHATVGDIRITYGMGWGGQFLVVIPTLHCVIVANQSIDDATAIRQEAIFTGKIFPVLLNYVR